MSVYRHYDNCNQVASFYILPLSISITVYKYINWDTMELMGKQQDGSKTG
jgi:hypothetical protein